METSSKEPKILVVREDKATLPTYATIGSAGADVRAVLDTPIVLGALERRLIHTNLYLDIPFGYEVQVRPRSGLALKNGITVLNTPGTIDSDYKGEVGVILVNLSTEPFTVHDGDRIAQLVVAKVDPLKFEWTELTKEELKASSERGNGGFGHTGV